VSSWPRPRIGWATRSARSGGRSQGPGPGSSPEPLADDPRNEDPPVQQRDALGMQQPGMAVPLQEPLQPQAEGVLERAVPPEPGFSQGRLQELLEEPDMGLVEPETAGRGIAGFGTRETLQIGLPDHVQLPVRQAGAPELQEPAGAVVLVPQDLPGTALRDDPQILHRRIPTPAQMPALTHAERPVVCIEAPEGQSIRTLPDRDRTQGNRIKTRSRSDPWTGHHP